MMTMQGVSVSAISQRGSEDGASGRTDVLQSFHTFPKQYVCIILIQLNFT